MAGAELPERISLKYSVIAIAGLLQVVTSSAEPVFFVPESVVPAHTVIVILENKSASDVYSNKHMPFLNSLAARGAVMTNATFGQTPYGRTPHGYQGPLPTRPSQPNYLMLFSGNNQNVKPEYFENTEASGTYPYLGMASNASNGDLLEAAKLNVKVGIGNRPIPKDMLPLITPNLGSALRDAGKTFASFSESLPYPSFEAEAFDSGHGLYKRKHNPVINWIAIGNKNINSADTRHLVALESNLGFEPTIDSATGKSYRGFTNDASGRPIGFEQLPTVSLVIPNQDNDAHDGSLVQADKWLLKNIKPYADWAMTHHSLLIITFDEDGSTKAAMGGAKKAGIDNIATLFFGPMVKPGRYGEPVDHLNVLGTLLLLHADISAFTREYGTAYPNDSAEFEAANIRPIRDIFGIGPALNPVEVVSTNGK